VIRFAKGNLLEADAEALVNTVNEVGVMGKGIALLFRDQFPENTRVYESAAQHDDVHIGKMLVVPTGALFGPKWIFNFPTKRHWRNPSRLEWIRAGLRDLVRVIRALDIKSIAVPPLGCGNGGLEWQHVKRLIEAAASDVPDVDFLVYEPTSAYHNAQKRAGFEKLTPARALIAAAVRRYAVLGFECTVLEVQKLAWFLMRSIQAVGINDPLQLTFSANKYGPYSDKLRHLLNGLDGSYLHCEKRLSDAGPLDLLWFETEKLSTVEDYLSQPDAQPLGAALDRVASIIEGFESPLGMELLATVDWLLSEKHVEPTLDGIRGGIAAWPASKAAANRKAKLFDDRMLLLALDRLISVGL
jgi:O-acetyl-ADP-ribose deacetylase (regulator of RNase III)